jgi:CheY-like chemotaxis protein
MNAISAKILIVDDEANIRNALAKLLTKTGFTVKSAANSQEALAMLR